MQLNPNKEQNLIRCGLRQGERGGISCCKLTMANCDWVAYNTESESLPVQYNKKIE